MKLVALAVLLAGCSARITGPRDTGLDLLALSKVQPALWLPGTKVVLTGRSFVGDDLGSSTVRLTGTLGGTAIDQVLDATFVADDQLTAVSDGKLADGHFSGTASVEVLSTVDMRTHASDPIMLELDFAHTLTPTVSDVGDGLSFVNQPTIVAGDGFLLGGDEGQTVAHLEGCFVPQGQVTCAPITAVDIPAVPQRDFDRTTVVFPYTTDISGIGPGSFTGTLTVENQLAGGTMTAAPPRAVQFDIQPPMILGASTTAASLGQYVDINGGGFVGDSTGAQSTLLDLVGSFAPDAGGAAVPINLELVTQFVSGPKVRYVLDETDALGQIINLRTQSGVITGTVTPVVVSGTTRVTGAATPVQLTILPIKQVVYVHFLDSYISSLRKFGLRAADPLIRARVLAIAARDYAGVHTDFRTAPPDDFSLFAIVDIAGPDPNNQGLLGYDNSPGKDSGNLRLYDHIGGVDATTQADGYPGFGGVFAEGFFGFSNHPNGLADPIGDDTSQFDAIFDPFRPDIAGGVELTATELADLAPPTLTDGSSCPAQDRTGQIACAVFVLGNLIGTTMTHEVGHSLGLANPYQDGFFHDIGDLPNRLMDTGDARPFNERVEMGAGPGVFCDAEFGYLQMILPPPPGTPPVTTLRPPCGE
jgi:hypothetical protein